MPTCESHPTATPTVLPLSRKSPKGVLRWYLASCSVGQERITCKKVRAIVSPELLVDAFVPRVERQKKYHGEWRRTVVGLLKAGGYFIVATRDS